MISTEQYKSDGLSIEAFIVHKKSKSKYCIVYVRGGNNHPSQNHKLDIVKDEMKDFLPFLKHNTCTIATNFRGSANSEGADEMGGADLCDILNLGPIINRYCTKNVKIILLGWSIGGMKVLQILSNKKYYSSWLKQVYCCILIAPVTNLLDMKKFRPFLYTHWKKDFHLSDKVLINRSAINFIKKLPKIPFLILQGAVDDKVNPVTNLLFTTELMKFMKNISMKLIPNESHGLSNYNWQSDIIEFCQL